MATETSREAQLSPREMAGGARELKPTAPVNGPKGARVGDVVIAERTRWVVIDLDGDRREAVCELLQGSHALRRFRARRIERVERAPRRRAGHIGQLGLDVSYPERGSAAASVTA
jgi:hypothetical protein